MPRDRYLLESYASIFYSLSTRRVGHDQLLNLGKLKCGSVHRRLVLEAVQNIRGPPIRYQKRKRPRWEDFCRMLWKEILGTSSRSATTSLILRSRRKVPDISATVVIPIFLSGKLDKLCTPRSVRMAQNNSPYHTNNDASLIPTNFNNSTSFNNNSTFISTTLQGTIFRHQSRRT